MQEGFCLYTVANQSQLQLQNLSLRAFNLVLTFNFDNLHPLKFTSCIFFSLKKNGQVKKVIFCSDFLPY